MQEPHTKPSAQAAASKKAAATRASNEARMKSPINTPGLLTDDPPSPVLVQGKHERDDQHVHGARAPLRLWVRFRDLKVAGIVASWVQLRRLIQTKDFPPGRYAGNNTRIWTAAEIEAWMDSRPSAERAALAESAGPLEGAAE